MANVPCTACDGFGYYVSYSQNGLPEQEMCDYCNGLGKEGVSEEQYKIFWKNFKESDFK